MNAVAEDFKADLKSVATALAQHDRVDNVQTKHVDAAFASLSRAGLSCKAFFLRSQFWSGFGGALAGASFSVPSVTEPAATYLSVAWVNNLTFPSQLFVLSLGITIFIVAQVVSAVPRSK